MYKKSSISDVEYGGHLANSPDDNTDVVVDLLPIGNPDYYKRDGTTGPGVLYKEKGATDFTNLLENNGGANVFIRNSKEKKRIKPSLCPKTHCPPSFEYSIG